MQVTTNIDHCHQCRDVGHSGSFTARGARTICDRSEACKARRSKTAFKKEYPEYRNDIHEGWKHHWYHRIVPDKGIPNWCPLKHGARY